ncbi:MAG: hemN [Ferruginibacter sp.]|nr:hemN [Ferruginibacter sp.]
MYFCVIKIIFCRFVRFYICKMEDDSKINPLLVKKYNQPVPRYTSYPTESFWENDFAPNTWSSIFQQKFNNHNHTDGISIYIHLPFCESACTYCRSTKQVTSNHQVEDEYLLAIEKEWKLYRNLMQQTPVIREIHLGGGTPTFFSPQNLRRLLLLILKNSIVHPVYEFSVEAHPNNTTPKHLEMLVSLGFRRISFGVPDIDTEVQHAVHRMQSFETIRNVALLARETGFTSVTFDLMYGLPRQTIKTIEHTIEAVLTLKPDRIAFQRYMRAPAFYDAAAASDASDMVAGEKNIRMYLSGKEMLLRNDYYDIGMDYFALTNDNLYKARNKGKLHRNFMGYSAQDTGLLLGLGVSGISDTGNAFAQNNKVLSGYYTSINSSHLAVNKGYILNEEDILFRKNILDISCKGKTSFTDKQSSLLEQYTFPELALFAAEDLVKYDKAGVEVTKQGHFFMRNICSAFDMHFQRNKAIAN